VTVSGVVRAEESLPDVLRRVAPSVVQVEVDKEAVGSGFVYPTPRHVTTVYTAINDDGEVWVVQGRKLWILASSSGR
jgi:S1-C subfamily serine protease